MKILKIPGLFFLCLALCFACPAPNADLPVISLDNLAQIYSGNGVIPNLLTLGTMNLAETDKLNILILPEGYQEADLAAGAFNTDAAQWVAAAELVEPLAHFKNAFNIRQYNIASSEHVIMSDTGKADTALAVPVDSTGCIGDALDETAVLVWHIAGSLGLVKAPYYPDGGNTRFINKNLVVVILVFDPASGASGFSGISRRLSNPNNSSQRISTAFACNTTHEFLHAFARLADEYMENDSGKMGEPNAAAVLAPTLCNVVDDANSSTVPWQHLLHGSSINPGTGNLTGCFGNAANGYHPEAKCLMNGTHDNALYYGGNGYLRTSGRLCNWCREITVFRIYERLGVFTHPTLDFAAWTGSYRGNFYALYPFNAPAGDIPQTNNAGQVIPSVWY